MKSKSLFKKSNIVLLYTYFLSKENDKIKKFLVRSKSLNDDWFEDFKQNKVKVYKKINLNLSDGWTIDRIPLIEKSVLSVSIYELSISNLKKKKINAIKLINKAVEFSKKYLDFNKFRYVNAVLDSILKELISVPV